MKYSGKVTINAGALHAGVQRITDQLNETMRSFGVDQQVLVRTEIGAFGFDSAEHFTYQQLEDIRQKAEGIMRDKEPTWDFRVGQITSSW